MTELIELTVRHPEPSVAVVEVSGELTAASGDALASAYTRADKTGVHGIVLDFTGLDYMNSGGLGVLVTLLVRANRHQQRVVAHGLADHYRQILTVTRLDEAISVVGDEAAALAIAGVRR